MKRKTRNTNDSRINRRQALKWGLVAGGSALFYIKKFRASADSGPVGTASPYVRPFVQPLAVPPLHQSLPMGAMNPAPDPARHQGGFQWGLPECYEVRVREFRHEWHPQLPKSRMWGYNAMFPGPTMIARYGHPMYYRFHNELPADHVGFGKPEISVHLHNHHSASESDGYPGNFFGSGQWWDNHYPLFPAGYDNREVINTMWYHDHRFDFTSQNVYRGMAGFCLAFDELDSGDEKDPNPNALRLPSGYGVYDIPLIFSDPRFDQDGELFFDMFNLDGVLGDRFAVNGKIQPFFKVARRKYRFRLLAGGPSRFWRLHLSDNRPFWRISNDGNLYERPLLTDHVQLGVAERGDIVIDFSQYRIGDSVYLENQLEQFDGRGPNQNILTPGIPMLRFDIDRDAPEPDNSRVPSFLRELPPVNLNEVVQRRTWAFGRSGGAWTINNQIFDNNVVRAAVKLGTAEIWTLQNGGGWAHPAHIHFEEGQILSRNGLPPEPHEKCRKDVYVVYPGDEIVLFLRFRDWLGRYPMHCHNTVHEDHAMMLRWDTIP